MRFAWKGNMSTVISHNVPDPVIYGDSDTSVSLEEPCVLIVDCDPSPILKHFRELASLGTFRIELARTGAAAIESIARDAPNVILLDSHLPDECGMKIHRQIKRIDPRIPVIILTSDSTADAAIQAMKQGAYDLLFKPVDYGQLQNMILAAVKVAPRTRRPRPAVPSLSESEARYAFVGTSLKMCEVYKSIGLVAGQDVNVLITGESGTGKELVARSIYEHSTRSDRPFLALNCAAIPENLLESELFGHEKGAFSGADRRRIGKFEQCDGGTILLDEIGDMPLTLQAKILRILQDQTFERIGGSDTIRTNVRIIASTHRDLKSCSAQGVFRADLYYRLSVFTIELPPLRERIEDLPTLTQQFIRRYSREMGRETHGITKEAMKRLQEYSWPGNIRELQSVIKQALLRSSGDMLLASSLPPLLDSISQNSTKMSPLKKDFDIDEFLRDRLRADTCNLYADLHRELDRHSLLRILTYTRGNRVTASRMLGIARRTLRVKLRESGLHISQSVDAGEGAISCGTWKST
jgi:DNA-binding NtrC family response regulator